MAKRILISGATGLIGSAIFQALSKRGDVPVALSRNTASVTSKLGADALAVEWDLRSPEKWAGEINRADAVVHLAGASLMEKRWSPEYKEKILSSRINGTSAIVDAIARSDRKPECLVSASAIGYYDEKSPDELNENSPAGSGFLSRVCAEWEAQAARSESFGVRNVRVRIGVVLDRRGGALPSMVMPYKYFVGGYLGSGRQWLSWVHIEDLVNIFLYALDNQSIRGPVNATAPNPVTMKEFSRHISRVFARPSWLNIPDWLLNIAVGEAASTITEGARVLPEKLISSGFVFKYSDAGEALKELSRQQS